MRILLCFALLSALAVACFGQDGKQQKPQKPETETASTEQQEKELSVVIEDRATIYRTIGRAEITYHEETDSSEVRAELGTVYYGMGRSIGMYALFKVAGKVITRPQEVVLSIVKRAKLKGDTEALDGFTVEADGERISFLSLTRGELQYGIDEKRYLRDLEARLAFSQFERIANGDKVKIQVGETVFQLSRKQREGLRDMLEAIKSPAQ